MCVYNVVPIFLLVPSNKSERKTVSRKSCVVPLRDVFLSEEGFSGVTFLEFRVYQRHTILKSLSYGTIKACIYKYNKKKIYYKIT